MSPLVFLLVALAGGVGAIARFVLDGVIRARAGTRLPWGTIAINVSGSLVLGIVTGLAASAALPPEAAIIVGTGFLGGYTTFSTASFETVTLVRDRRHLLAAANGLGVLATCTLIAALGLWLGMAVGAAIA